MLTEFARDHAFTIGWFGLMAFVWFGWAQEDPPIRWRWWLGLGSGAGAVLAGIFGYAVAARWGEVSALEGRYGWFGALVLAEVLLAVLGCLVLRRRGVGRWAAWWVALVVGLHFLPLAVLLGDGSLALLGASQGVGLLLLMPRLRGTSSPTSRLAGPFMGITLLLFAAASLVVYLVRW
jgi:hypothetical protein